MNTAALLSHTINTGDGCWEFRERTKSGYGRIYHEGRQWRAHRLMWTVVNGAIPKGLYVLHKCDNRACVRISHLFLGTHADNMRDASNKGRLRLQKHPERCNLPSISSKLTPEQVSEIRLRINAGEAGARLAREFGIRPEHALNIAKGKAWKRL